LSGKGVKRHDFMIVFRKRREIWVFLGISESERKSLMFEESALGDLLELGNSVEGSSEHFMSG
jgi:hypothetical protein